MTRQLALLLLSATLVSCMEMKETVQRLVMVRTSGSDPKPETKGFMYERQNDGPPKVIKMGQDEVMEELTKMYKFPQAFYAPIPYAAGPFYNKEEVSQNTGLFTREQVLPVFENIEESNEIKSDSVPAAAEQIDQAKLYPPNMFDDYTNDFNEYLVSLGYHDDFYRGGSWSEYGNSDNYDISAANSVPNQYRYNMDYEKPTGSSEKYAIYTLLSTTDSDERHKKNKGSYETSNVKKNKNDKFNDNFRKDEYASEFDVYSKTEDNDYEKPALEKKGDKYHRDIDVYDYQKDNNGSHVKATRDSEKRIQNVYDDMDSGKPDEDNKTENQDFNARIAHELRDCCYEEKPKQEESSSEGDIKVHHRLYDYEVTERQ